jgi:UMF1 family MFS transporter
MKHTRQKWGWAMYDWANSSFATIVMAGFFPVFFKEYWNAGLDPAESTFRLGMTNSVASLLVVLMAPVLGAIADCLGRRKAMLFFVLLRISGFVDDGEPVPGRRGRVDAGCFSVCIRADRVFRQ